MVFDVLHCRERTTHTTERGLGELQGALFPP